MSVVNRLQGFGITIGKPDAWAQYFWGDLVPGQNVEEVIRVSRPARVDRYSRYVRLEYGSDGFVGLTAIAKDGKLAFARAWECTRSHTFFDTLSPKDWEEFSK